MKISEFISKLNAFMSEHGDLDVVSSQLFGQIVDPVPYLRYRSKVKNYNGFFKLHVMYRDPDGNKGGPVCCV